MTHKKKLAIISSRFPYPLNKGDKLRLFHQIRYLSDHFEIYLYAINEEKISRSEQTPVRRLCKEVKTFRLNLLQKIFGIGKSLLKREPIQVGYFYSKQIETQIKNDLKMKKIDAVYCQLSRTAPYGLTFKGPVVFDYQDCFSKNYERAYQKATFIKKCFYKREWKCMLRYEQKIHHDFVAKTIISENDRQMLPFDSTRIHIVSNGVDPQYYKPMDCAKEFDILFSGNLNYQPNIEGALELIETVFPLLKKSKPDIKIAIAGNTTNEKILHAANVNIIVQPHVEDMRQMYCRTKIYVAPLFSGAGLQNKLLEAMCMGIPCIATEITNQSLKAKPNVEIIEVANSTELAASVIALLNQPDKIKLIGEKGQAYVRQHFSWTIEGEKLRKIIENLL